MSNKIKTVYKLLVIIQLRFPFRLFVIIKMSRAIVIFTWRISLLNRAFVANVIPAPSVQLAI